MRIAVKSMDLNLFDRIFEVANAGGSYVSLSKTLRLSPSYLCRLFQACKAAPYEDVKRVLVDGQTKCYTSAQLSEMADTIVRAKIPVSVAAIRYQLEFNRLAKLVKLRKDKGRSLTPHDLEQPWVKAMWMSDEMYALSLRLPKGTFITPHSIVYASRDLTDEELQALEAAKAQRARQPVPYQAGKPSRSALGFLDDDTPDIEGHDSSLVYTPTFFYGHPASDYLDEKGQPTLDTTLDPLPFVNPDSPGFEKLPKAVQYYSLERSREVLKAENAYYKRKRGE